MATLDSILSRYVTGTDEHKDGLQAAAFTVVDKTGKTIYSKSFGKQNFSPDSPPFTQDTVCWIASLTKLIVSVCALQIVEKGLVGLDDDVGKIIPELSNMDVIQGFGEGDIPQFTKQTGPITLRRLLSHSSGLSWDIDPDIRKWSIATNRTITTSSDVLEAFVFPLKFQSGEGWIYGVSVDWVGRLIEVLCNTTLEAYMQQHICKPLGMDSTTLKLSAHPDLAARRAQIGNRTAEGKLVANAIERANIDRKVMGGGGGIFSTANDYAKVLASLISNDGKLLQEESIRLLRTPTLTDASRAQFQELCDDSWHFFICPEFPRGTPVDYGLCGAVNLADIPGKRRKGSLMWSGLTNPHWWMDTESGIAAVLMVQVLEHADPVVIRLYDELERAVYQDLL